jgi:hypothetical protein
MLVQAIITRHASGRKRYACPFRFVFFSRAGPNWHENWSRGAGVPIGDATGGGGRTLGKHWWTLGRAVFRVARRMAPVLCSAALVTWLVWQITPARLAQAAATPVMAWLVLATLVQLVVLMVWDTVSLWWLFAQPDRPIPFLTVLHARTDSILWSAFNLEVGQAVFAWKLARIQHTSIKNALARCVVLGMFDFGTLQAIALVGTLVHDDPLVHLLRWIPLITLPGLLLVAVTVRFLPASWRGWLEGKTWGSWLRWWTWRHSVLLAAQRLLLFLLVLLYAGVGLALCGLEVDVRTVVGVIPFVLIAEALPGTAGLGPRETALVYLLHPADDEQRALLLAFGLTWSVVVILGRLAIGLVSRYLLPAHIEAGEALEGPSKEQPPCGM